MYYIVLTFGMFTKPKAPIPIFTNPN